MKSIIKNERVIAAVATILLFMSVFGTAYYYENSKTLNIGLNEEKLKSELVLSEKLSIERDFANLSKELGKWKGKNTSLNNNISTLEQKIAQKETELKNIVWEKGKTKKLEKQINDIKNAKNQILEEKNSIVAKLEKLEKENKDLSQLVATLQTKNKDLINDMKLMSSISTDNFLMETQRKNGKLTIIAKRTQKIDLSFDLPQDVASKINFKIIKPDGSSVSEEKDGISYIVGNTEPVYTASTEKGLGEIEVNKRIQMTYKPLEKLKSGTYKVQLFNNKTYIGSCQVKLR